LSVTSPANWLHCSVNVAAVCLHEQSTRDVEGGNRVRHGLPSEKRTGSLSIEPSAGGTKAGCSGILANRKGLTIACRSLTDPTVRLSLVTLLHLHTPIHPLAVLDTLPHPSAAQTVSLSTRSWQDIRRTQRQCMRHARASKQVALSPSHPVAAGARPGFDRGCKDLQGESSAILHTSLAPDEPNSRPANNTSNAGAAFVRSTKRESGFQCPRRMSSTCALRNVSAAHIHPPRRQHTPSPKSPPTTLSSRLRRPLPASVCLRHGSSRTTLNPTHRKEMQMRVS
jgi:hypothetical protein